MLPPPKNKEKTLEAKRKEKKKEKGRGQLLLLQYRTLRSLVHNPSNRIERVRVTHTKQPEKETLLGCAERSPARARVSRIGHDGVGVWYAATYRYNTSGRAALGHTQLANNTCEYQV